MIKIGPLYATDYAQICALLKLQPEYELTATTGNESSFLLRGLTFWQHWIPAQWHIAPSAYVAREDNAVIGLIAAKSLGKSKETWQIDHLAVHPDHRGRGIAQELIRYVFAQFGSQGAGHFVAELSDQNTAGLGLFSSCGFRRYAKIKHFKINLADFDTNYDTENLHYRASTPADAQTIFQLFQEATPPDMRLILSYSPNDFLVSDHTFEKINQLKQRFQSTQTEYWLGEDPQRRTLVSAVKVVFYKDGHFYIECMVHPGWQENTQEILCYVLGRLKSQFGSGFVYTKCFDFQVQLLKVLNENKLTYLGDYSLLVREHWVRAKQKKPLLSRPDLSVIQNVVGNLPSPSTYTVDNNF